MSNSRCNPNIDEKTIYGKLRRDIGRYLRRLCDYKGVEIIKANACINHIHMLVKIPPKMVVSSFMVYLKRKSALMMFEEHANLKYKYGSRNFWPEHNKLEYLNEAKKLFSNVILADEGNIINLLSIKK